MSNGCVAYASFHFLVWIFFSDNQAMERMEMQFSRAKERGWSETFLILLLLFLMNYPFFYEQKKNLMLACM